MGTVTTAGDPYAGPAAAITPTSLGLGNVTNTSDANKPVSTAQLAAIQARSNAAATTTWANRAAAIASIAALTPGTGWVFVSDVGVNGSLWWCNGSVLVHDAPINLLNSSQQYIVHAFLAANAATFSQTGTTVTIVSAVHNIPALSYNGAMIYLPIGTVSSGVAPTAAVANWFTNFQYVDANTFTVTATNTQSATGFVNSNLAQTIITPLSSTLLGGLLGTSSKLRLSTLLTANTTAGNKLLKWLFNSIYAYGATLTTSGTTFPVSIVASNRNGITNLQQSVSGSTTWNIDTTVNQSLGYSITLVANSDWLSLNMAIMELLP